MFAAPGVGGERWFRATSQEGQNSGQEVPEVPQGAEGDAEPTQTPRDELKEVEGRPGMQAL